MDVCVWHSVERMVPTNALWKFVNFEMAADVLWGGNGITWGLVDFDSLFFVAPTLQSL